MYYTYVHRRASDNLIFYVGKGQKRRAWSIKGRNTHWHNSVKKHGIIVEIFNLFDNEKDAFADEIKLISVLSSFMPLTNQTSGGEGVSGYKYSLEQIEKIKKRNSGDKNPNFGKKHTIDAIERMKNAKKGNHNPMFERSGKLSPTAKQVKIEYLTSEIKYFDSLTSASNFTGINLSDFSKYMKQTRNIPKKYGIKKIENVIY